MEGPSVFATGFTLDDVLEAIRDTDEFKVSKYADGNSGAELLFFNYRFCSPKTFPALDKATSERERLIFAIKRECRGLVFRTEPGKEAVLTARMFHKFFNIGEKEETQPERISLSRPHTLCVKHDGSLVAPVLFNGKVQFGERMRVTCCGVALTREDSDQVGLQRGGQAD
jgi:hypothetical protein